LISAEQTPDGAGDESEWGSHLAVMLRGGILSVRQPAHATNAVSPSSEKGKEKKLVLFDIAWLFCSRTIDCIFDQLELIINPETQFTT